jgi:8-oxo-dGTP pyrophosphatase MutT (NUDIX family)
VQFSEGQLWADTLGQHLKRYPSAGTDAATLQLKEAAVLAPVFWREGEPFVLLTRRPETLRKHPGQISFPGGGHEPTDVTPLHTALRETEEELGLPRSAVQVLGLLGRMPTPTGYNITPFVGYLPNMVPLRPSQAEIAAVLEAPLWRLRREKRQIFHAERDVFVWGDGGEVVWGATWRMLHQLLEHVEAIGQ